MMKRVWMAMLPGLLMVGCQVAPTPDAPAEPGEVTPAAKPQGYEALPGKAATSSAPSDTDAAFESAAAALRNSASTAAAEPEKPQAEPAEPEPVNADPPDLRREEDAPRPPAAEPAPQKQEVSVAPAVVQPVVAPAASPGVGAGYAVQVTNGTPWRLFIEVQDASGNIFPFGFMYANQRLSAQPQEPKPLEGELAIIIRDPDQPGAPEVRRYQVPLPPQYMGKTLGVTLLPGRVRAAVDGEPYYSSPLPEDKPEPAN